MLNIISLFYIPLHSECSWFIEIIGRVFKTFDSLKNATVEICLSLEHDPHKFRSHWSSEVDFSSKSLFIFDWFSYHHPHYFFSYFEIWYGWEYIEVFILNGIGLTSTRSHLLVAYYCYLDGSQMKLWYFRRIVSISNSRKIKCDCRFSLWKYMLRICHESADKDHGAIRNFHITTIWCLCYVLVSPLPLEMEFLKYVKQ